MNTFLGNLNIVHSYIGICYIATLKYTYFKNKTTKIDSMFRQLCENFWFKYYVIYGMERLYIIYICIICMQLHSYYIHMCITLLCLVYVHTYVCMYVIIDASYVCVYYWCCPMQITWINWCTGSAPLQCLLNFAHLCLN